MRTTETLTVLPTKGFGSKQSSYTTLAAQASPNATAPASVAKHRLSSTKALTRSRALQDRGDGALLLLNIVVRLSKIFDCRFNEELTRDDVEGSGSIQPFVVDAIRKSATRNAKPPLIILDRFIFASNVIELSCCFLLLMHPMREKVTCSSTYSIDDTK